MATGEYFEPLDNGLWKDKRSGEIGRLKKGKGHGWYVDENDQTPMGKREKRIKNNHINNTEFETEEILKQLNNANKEEKKAKTEPEWNKAKDHIEIWQKYYETRQKDEEFWDLYDNPTEDKGNFANLEGNHIINRFKKRKGK